MNAVVETPGVAAGSLARLIDALPEASLVVDGSGLVLSANRAAASLLGCTDVELVGQSLTDLACGDAAAVNALLRAGSRSLQRLPGALEFSVGAAPAAKLRCEIILFEPRHADRPALLCLRLFERHPSARQFMLLNQRIDELSREITRRREAEDRLHEKSRQLIDAGRRKDEFMAMLGHELRNPLAPIALGIDLLQRIEPPHPRVEQVTAMMKRQVSHMTRLINDLLDVARLTHGKMALKKRPELLEPVLARAVELVRASVDERGLQLSVGPVPAYVRVDADADRLVQVFGNLLGNAVKFSDAGGAIRLNTRVDAGVVTVEISDDGAGIDHELLSQVFEPFVQDDHSLDRAKGGLGIGLSIVKGIVELHGGEITAHSDGRGHGTTMRVCLPLADLAAQAAPPTADGPEPVLHEASRKLRVMVVEDNPDSAEAMRELLGDWGHQAVYVGNGNLAIELWERWQPDVALLDIGLPGLSGHQVARRLRELSAGARLLLIAISGYGAPGDLQQSADSGFDLHLCKPVDLDRLQSILAAHAVEAQRQAD